jgi:hypothetical protein
MLDSAFAGGYGCPLEIKNKTGWGIPVRSHFRLDYFAFLAKEAHSVQSQLVALGLQQPTLISFSVQ